MKAAFPLGRSLGRRERAELGFPRDRAPCHATLTETPRILDPHALAEVLCALCVETNGEARHIAIDGKTMRASKNGEGKAEHVFRRFAAAFRPCSNRKRHAERVSKSPTH